LEYEGGRARSSRKARSSYRRTHSPSITTRFADGIESGGPPGRVDVTVDDENYEAGSGNIIVITIRNPFEVPISVLELTDPKATSLRSARKQVLSQPNEKKRPFRETLTSLFSGFGSAVTASIGFGGISAQFSTPNRDRKLLVNSSGDATINITDVISKFDQIEINTTGDTKIVAPVPTDGTTPVRVIQPHCEANAFLTIDTKGWLFAKPTRLRLKSELLYRIEGDVKEYSQVVPLTFDVRPPLRSVVIGAICGAILGGAARFINDVLIAKRDVLSLSLHDWLLQAIQLSGSAIMAVIATIALSRKTGAQGFITVEDLFGGFVVGVLISYEGTSYFEQILRKQGGLGGQQADH
jgi:hypothetical protein